ncbi:MAG: membrane protein insertion efficiency factor YidD [candidate division WOR-3 bacterium]
MKGWESAPDKDYSENIVILACLKAVSRKIYHFGVPVILLSLAPSVFSNPAKLSAWLVIKTYQLTLSELQPDVCNFNPSCSRYGEAAVKKYGVIGILMAGDRLMRCNPTSWLYLGEEYDMRGGKLHENQDDYYIFSKPEYPKEVLYPW